MNLVRFCLSTHITNSLRRKDNAIIVHGNYRISFYIAGGCETINGLVTKVWVML